MATRAEERQKKRRLKRRKRIIGTIKFIIILAALYAFIFCTPFFNVKSIEVEGADTTSTQSVISSSGIVPGTHILKVNLKSAKQEVEKLAYVKKADVKRAFPNKIKITVTEGKVIANIALAEGFAAIDETGKVMEISDTPKVFPAIYGVAVKKSEVGEKITIDETAPFDVILKYVDALSSQALATPCVSVNLTEGDIWAELENGVLVRFGDDTEIEYKVAAFAESLRSAGELSEGFFDATSPDRIIYSEKSPFDQPEDEPAETDSAENSEGSDAESETATEESAAE